MPVVLNATVGLPVSPAVALRPSNKLELRMRSFREMLDSCSDEELGAKVRDRYARMIEATDMGIEGAEHPATSWNNMNTVLKAHAVAKDALEESDQPAAQDDPPPTPGTPRSPERGAPALDSVIPGYGRILAQNRDKRVIDDDMIVQSTPRGW